MQQSYQQSAGVLNVLAVAAEGTAGKGSAGALAGEWFSYASSRSPHEPESKRGVFVRDQLTRASASPFLAHLVVAVPRPVDLAAVGLVWGAPQIGAESPVALRR